MLAGNHGQTRDGTMRILIADDDPTTRKMLKSLTTKWGFDPVTAEDGEQALQFLREDDAPRLAILDWMMPGKSGLDVCNEVHGDDSPLTYTILVTSLTASKYVVAALEAGAHDYVTKPVNAAELKSRIGVGVRTLAYEKSILEKSQALFQARKMESIGNLAGGVAHEINSPIQHIGNSLEFLQDSFTTLDDVLKTVTELPPGVDGDSVSSQAVHAAVEEADLEFLREEIPVSIQEAREGIGQVSMVIKAMQHFVATDDENEAELDLNRTIRDTLAVAAHLFKARTTVHTDYDEVLPIACNSNEMGQVLLNLILNATEAIERRPVEADREDAIEIRTLQDEADVVMTISDTGDGIPDDIRDRIFDQFFTTKDVGEGTGLGLFICWSTIVEKLGGSIACASAPGSGTTFTVRIPACATEPQPCGCATDEETIG